MKNVKMEMTFGIVSVFGKDKDAYNIISYLQRVLEHLNLPRYFEEFPDFHLRISDLGWRGVHVENPWEVPAGKTVADSKNFQENIRGFQRAKGGIKIWAYGLCRNSFSVIINFQLRNRILDMKNVHRHQFNA